MNERIQKGDAQRLLKSAVRVYFFESSDEDMSGGTAAAHYHDELELLTAFNLLDKASVPRGNGAILYMRPKLSALNADNYIVPIWMI